MLLHEAAVLQRNIHKAYLISLRIRGKGDDFHPQADETPACLGEDFGADALNQIGSDAESHRIAKCGTSSARYGRIRPCWSRYQGSARQNVH